VRAALCILTILTSLGIPAARADARPAAPAPREVPANARPYNGSQISPKHEIGLVDDDGVRMFRHPAYTGGQARNHPVAQAQYGLLLLNTYRLKHDAWFLDRAERQARRMIATRVESRGAWWFPYPFDYPLASGMNYTQQQPWYSAMAQGQAISLFIRLAQATGDASWRTAADRAFLSLRLGFSNAGPWVTHRDGNGRLWLEEYPARTPTGSGRVLNGHLFAMYGVWDYWNLTKSTVAARLFADAGATVKRYVLRNFRNPGWASSYALRGLAPTEKYHTIHVDQLLHMHALSGDATFAALAETLQADFSAPKQNAAILFTAGQHTGIRFGSTAGGDVAGRRLLGLRAASAAPADERRRIGGQPGYWYHVTAGRLKDLWVQEVPGIRATLRPVSTVNYLAVRVVRMASGRHRVCSATRCSVARVSSPARYRVGAIGWIRGERAVKITAGRLKNWWLPLTPRTTLH